MSYQHPAAVRRVLESMAAFVCPPEATELGLIPAIVDHVGLTMSALPPLFRRGLLAGVLTYDLGAIVWPRARGRRAHKLAPEVGRRYFESWLHGPTPLHRQLAIGLRQLIALGCYEQPQMQARLGYTPGPWIEKVTKRRLEVYADDIQRHQQALIAPDPLPGHRSVGASTPRRAKEVA